MKTAIVIGAGIGVRAGTMEIDGFRYTGPSWLLTPNAFEHYYALLDEDIRDHKYLCLSTGTGIR